MHEIPWGTAATVFLGMLPLVGLLAWYLTEFARLRAEMRAGFAQLRAGKKP